MLTEYQKKKQICVLWVKVLCFCGVRGRSPRKILKLRKSYKSPPPLRISKIDEKGGGAICSDILRYVFLMTEKKMKCSEVFPWFLGRLNQYGN